MRSTLLALLLVLLVAGCSLNALFINTTPISPTSPESKIIVLDQFNLIRSVNLSLNKINYSDIEPSNSLIIAPGQYWLELQVFDANRDAYARKFTMGLKTEAGHTYVIKPKTYGLSSPVAIEVQIKVGDQLIMTLINPPMYPS